MHKDLKTIYTKTQFEEIKNLVREKVQAIPKKQKGIRDKIRKRGLYWDDLAKGTPFTVENLEMLVKNGILTITE